MAEPTTGVAFTGTLRDADGSLVTTGATADTFAVDQSTTGIGTQDATFSNGQFDVTDSGFGRFDVRIETSAAQIWWSARSKMQVTTLHARNPTTAEAALEVFSTTSEAESLVAVFGFRPATEASGAETADTPSDGDRGHINFELSNDNATPQQFIAARLAWEGVDVSDGTEDGQFNFWTMVAGTLTEELHLDATALWPESAAGLDLGKSSIGFNDIWLESGGIIDFAAGDVTLTHASNLLALGGGDFHIANTFGLVVGHTAQVAAAEGANHEVQILGTASIDSSLMVYLSNTNNAIFPALRSVKNANATIGTNTTSVADGEELGQVLWYGTDGTDADTLSAGFGAVVDDGSPAAGDIGTAFSWNQMPGGGGAIAESMVLGANGALTLKVSADSAAVANEVSIGRYEIGAGNTVLAFSQETVVAADADETKFSNKVQVRINGTSYFIMLTTT